MILSNVDRASFARSNARLGVAFDAIFTAEDIGTYKPDPANFRYLLARLGELGHQPADLLHVAQSLFHDLAPANAAGLASAWIDRRFAAPGGGATPEAEARYDFRFTSLGRIGRGAPGGAARLAVPRHRHPSPDPIGARQGRMGGGSGGDAGVEFGRERADAAGDQVDVQEHQFLRCGAQPVLEPKHLVRDVRRLSSVAMIWVETRHRLADQQLALVAVMGLGDKGAVVGVAAVARPEPQFLEQESVALSNSTT